MAGLHTLVPIVGHPARGSGHADPQRKIQRSVNTRSVPNRGARRWLAGRAGVGARLLTALGAAALVVLLTVSQVTAPLDAALFDTLAAGRVRPANARVVVIAIDADSERQLGPWPWPRRELAALVDRLSAAGTRAVGLQLLLAQPSLFDPQGDALLAEAIARNGAVVLPVVPDLPPAPQPATALLPAGELIQAAAGLGHVDVEVDRDGIARRLPLRACLDSARWPAFASALAALAGRDARTPPATSPATAAPPAAWPARAHWVRSQTVLLPYPDAQTRIAHVSAAGVLDGRVGADALAGRVALVGRPDAPTERLRAPGGRTLPALDVQANALARLLEGNAIWPMPVGAQALLSIMLVTLPLLLLGLPGLRRLWAPMVVAVGVTALLCWALLLAGAWFPPMPALLVLAVGLAAGGVRAWRRVRQRGLTDPQTGLANRAGFDLRLEQAVRRARRRRAPLSLLLVEIRPGASSAQDCGELAAAVAGALRLRARGPHDLAARLDSGRFAALLGGAQAHVAALVATALQADLEGRPGRAGPATAGQPLRMGLASLQAEDLQGADLLLRATRDLVAVREPFAR
ncbi:CHASE2 domain-containing protein [Pseudoxanthomonas winnipegensis]|uniref:CHASE2 domain-containing protein n=1 Tax=Pseudoxanthomonas winnipegensis TaxID=2480810 RepID=A0A4Q8M1W3_9GAMM|nr:CHASE2 domain-containing protein [Pseudoxanthomonas winnipegensis]TAA38099.1 CHASE2 domain-containing protein [Pseudoxanthomonas winnipegensis]